ncbi:MULTISPECIES: helix-turn-helix domain-containing protein [Pseudomonas syringae group]|uniref:Helix-turn-helix transcriptional regulator n=4 Tax=Pseudomonas syringae group TaxID=136849 RepID=A0AAW4DPE0_PSESX|nr:MULTISPECIES: helix-turn-helix transcriptional regulator [Pseudomonas syringae group]KGK92130.1 hypothetical protein NB04_28300 [Pseudomonas syringae pv. tomato]KUR47658.1 transcriptional repressor DicA [Pseudomonas syringae pv. tomato]KUR48063.1 transcriptional repressor DicA [Pseudomonas syringae pv. tomato]MBI6711652.1 helix-turn-helix transcriptional regulator [Pseudomonas syringae]MBI6735901.1 helix-turn-helix transcriptional regulator [Pseudomonas syringae]
MSGAKNSSTLGGRVKLARDATGLTQLELAELVGVSQAAISEIERGESARTAYLPEISRACGADIQWLAFGGERPASEPCEPAPTVAEKPQEISFCIEGMGFSGMPLKRVANYISALSDLVGKTAIFIRMTDSSIVFYDGSSSTAQNAPEAQ